MKIKVLKTTKQTKDGRSFPSYFTPVTIVVKGEEGKGPQEKCLTVRFSELAEKKLPVDFNGGFIEAKGEDVFAPYVWEMRKKDGKEYYPDVYLKDFESISPLPPRKPRENTCTFLLDEKETEESEIADEPASELPF